LLPALNNKSRQSGTWWWCL